MPLRYLKRGFSGQAAGRSNKHTTETARDGELGLDQQQEGP